MRREIMKEQNSEAEQNKQTKGPINAKSRRFWSWQKETDWSPLPAGASFPPSSEG